MFIHVDIDAFFASVEQRINPRLRGRPVIVGSGVIASCSYEARRAGLRAGMPLRRALRLCPEAVVRRGVRAVYEAFAEQVFACCRRVAPSVEAGLDEALCDMSGAERLCGDLPGTAARLRRAVRRRVGLRVSAGVAGTRLLARVAGRAAKPDGLAAVPAGGEAAFLDPLPVERLPGVGPATAATLYKMNVTHVRDLRLFSREALEALFGAPGAALYERCRGRDGGVTAAREIPRTVSRETALEPAESDRGAVRGTLHYLAERAGRTLRALGVVSRRVGVSLAYPDYVRAAGGASLPEGTALDGEIFRVAGELLDGLWRRRAAVLRVGVTLSRLAPAETGQGELFTDAARERARRLCRSVDAVRARFGHGALVVGPSLALLGGTARNAEGFVLRTPCLTK